MSNNLMVNFKSFTIKLFTIRHKKENPDEGSASGFKSLKSVEGCK